MDFKNNPGVQLIVEAYMEFAKKYDLNNAKAFGQKSTMDLIKAFKDVATKKDAKPRADLADAIEAQLPPEKVEEFFTDLHGLLYGPKVTQGLSMIAQSLDFTQIEGTINNFFDNLKDPMKNMQLAQSIKQLAQTEGVKHQLGFMLKKPLQNANLPPVLTTIIEAKIDELTDFIENSKDMSLQEISDALTRFADSVPTDMISQTVYGMVSAFTPEMLSTQLQRLVTTLPTPAEMAEQYVAGLNQLRGESKDAPAKAKTPRPANGGSTKPLKRRPPTAADDLNKAAPKKQTPANQNDKAAPKKTPAKPKRGFKPGK